MTGDTLLTVSGLTKSYGHGARRRAVVEDVGFELREGEVLGLVGESGSGKSTTVRCIVGLERPDEGTLDYTGIDLRRATAPEERRFRSEVQMVFQDPYSSLNPRMTVGRIVEEPLLSVGNMKRPARRDRVVEMLELVGLGSEHLTRHPRSFSGGQRQRIAIARALVRRPRVLICDEPVSALDVSVQAQVLNLLRDLQETLSLSVLFIAHDLAVVRHVCERLVVMKDGRVVEEGYRDEIYERPQTDYARALLDAVPRADPSGERDRRAARRVRSAAR